MPRDLLEGMDVQGGMSPPAPRDLLAEAKLVPAATPSTAGYIFGAAPMNTALGMGDILKQAETAGNPFAYTSGANPQLTPTAQAFSDANGRQAANARIFGAPEVQPPNDFARYTGAVSSAFAANPWLSATAPVYTIAGALGSEGGSDLNKAYGPSWMPDWLARLIGGAAGGLGWGGLKAGGSAIANVGTDRAVENAQDLLRRAQSGEGRIGQFQGSARAAAQSLSADNNPMPTIPSETPVSMPNTLRVLTEPNAPAPEGAAKLADLLNKRDLAMPYSSLVQWQQQFANEPALYNALKADRRLALTSTLGTDAGTAFDKANLATRARNFLSDARDPQGLYDPSKLTRAMARDPTTGEIFADASPQMSAAVDHASQLYGLVSPLARANADGPSILRRAAIGTAGLTAGHFGIPGAELLGGLGMSHAASAANPIYALPGGPRLSPWLLPATASQSGLLGSAAQQ